MMNTDWKAGDTEKPSGRLDYWTSGIDFPEQNHTMAIQVHAISEAEAIRRRNFILTSCEAAMRGGKAMDEAELLELAARHGFGRMVAKEKTRRIGPPPPDIFVGAWVDFLALAKAIPTIYRDRLNNLRDSLHDILGTTGSTDDELLQAAVRLKAGVKPITEPTVEQVAAFKLEFYTCQAANQTHNESIRRALKAALAAT